MNTIISLVLCGMMLLTGCESEEVRQERILDAVKTKIETNMADNEAYTLLANKEWSIVKKDDGYVVTLSGTLTYIVSIGASTHFTVSKDLYITDIDMYVGGEHTQHEDIPKSENSKLDI